MFLFVVIYPRAAGLFPIVYFIPGAPSGVIPAEWYTDILTRVASHGFIALAVDAFYPAAGLGSDAKLGAGGKLIDKHLHHLEWVSSNSVLHYNFAHEMCNFVSSYCVVFFPNKLLIVPR